MSTTINSSSSAKQNDDNKKTVIKSTAVKKESKSNSIPEVKLTKTKLPELSAFLKAGVQFGHQAKKWDPKMDKYIFTKRGNIHIIDLSKTLPLLEKALEVVTKKAAEGTVLIVGTKRQASGIVKEVAKDAGAFYMTNRWPGGFLTNFNLIKKSLKRFNNLEKEFETGVENRTKYEVSQMKKDWLKLNRTYEGVKSMSKFPKAMIIVDAKFERNAVREAKIAGIPVIALVDTNTDPGIVDYPIPANDDALKSITLLLKLFGEAILNGAKGKRITHRFKDYYTEDIEIKKAVVKVEKGEAVASSKTVGTVKTVARNFSKTTTIAAKNPPKKVSKSTFKPVQKVSKKKEVKGGMLENIQKKSETIKVKKAATKRGE